MEQKSPFLLKGLVLLRQVIHDYCRSKNLTIFHNVQQNQLLN